MLQGMQNATSLFIRLTNDLLMYPSATKKDMYGLNPLSAFLGAVTDQSLIYRSLESAQLLTFKFDGDDLIFAVI